MLESVVINASAAVDQSTLVIPTLAADLNAWSTLTVSPPLPVSTSTVWTRVLECVASMLSVESSTTTLSAPVYQDTSEIHSEAAVLNVSRA